MCRLRFCCELHILDEAHLFEREDLVNSSEYLVGRYGLLGVRAEPFTGLDS